MSKENIKSMNDLYFRWWKEEVQENESLLKEIAKLKEKNVKLKLKIHENSTQKR